MRRIRLLTGTSGICLLIYAGQPSSALAQQQVPSFVTPTGRTTFAFEGAFLNAHRETALQFDPNDDKFGDFHSLNAHRNGFLLGASLTRSIDPVWDLRAALRLNSYNSDTARGVNPDDTDTHLNARTKHHVTALDFEAGYSLPPIARLGAVRLFAGPRIIQSKNDIFYGYSDPGTKLGEFDHRSTLWAAGPRGGLDLTVPLNTNLTLNMSGSGSALFSNAEHKFDFHFDNDFSQPGSGHSQTNSHPTIYNLEASAALGFNITRNANLQLGYRGEFWQNLISGVKNADEFGNFDSTRANVLAHGPFAKITVTFD